MLDFMRAQNVSHVLFTTPFLQLEEEMLEEGQIEHFGAHPSRSEAGFDRDKTR